MPWSWYLIPFVAALIGWGTNLIAVKMLFRPRMPIGWGWFKLQGVVPRRHKALARSVAKTFDEELLSGDELVARFEALDLASDAEALLDQRLDNYLVKLKEKIPMAAMFLTPQLEAELKDQAFQEMIQVLPDLKAKIKEKLAHEYDLRKVLEEKIDAFELDKMEKIAFRVAKNELRAIELLGGLIGFVVGSAQLAFMWGCNC